MTNLNNTQQQIIQQQRTQIEEARKRALAVTKQAQIPRAQLLRQTMQQRASRQAQRKQRQLASQRQLKQIQQQAKQFEAQVAKVAPQFATPQQKQQAYQIAKQDISRKLASVQSGLASQQERLKYVTGKSRDALIENINRLEAQQRSYESALKGSAEQLIKGYYTGAIKRGIDIQQAQLRAQEQVGLVQEQFAKEQGFKTFKEYEKAYQAQQLAPVISEAKVEQAPGTYDPRTGIYISPEGVGMSTATPPPGAKIIGAPPVPSFLQPTFETPAQKQFYEKVIQPKFEAQQIETQRYKDLGYTSSEASKLATASLARGGFTFSPERAREIIRERPKDIKEFVTRGFEKAVVGVGVGLGASKVVSEIPIPDQSLISIATKGRIKTSRDIFRDLTVDERARLAELTGGALERPKTIGEAVGKPMEIVHTGLGGFWDMTRTGLKAAGVEETKIVPEREITLYDEQYGTQQVDPFTGEVVPFYKPKEIIIPEKEVVTAPFKITKGLEFGTKVLPYMISGPVTTAVIVSEIALAQQKYTHPDEIVNEALEGSWNQYQQDVKEKQKELKEGEELETLTRSEFDAKVIPEIISQVKRGASIEALTGLAFLGGAAAFKGVAVARTPVITKVPTRKVVDPFFVETAKVAVEEGKLIRIGKYKVIGETRPPIKVTETTKFRKWFKMKPKKEYVIPAKKFKQFTPFEVVGEEPFLVTELRTGQKYGTVFRMRGEGIPTDLKTLKGLSKTRQLEWKRLAEKVTGRPVALENVPKMLKKNIAKVESDIESRRLFRLFKEKAGVIKVTTPWMLGRAIRRAEAVSIIEPVVKTDLLKISKVKTIFKDVTKPFPRAIGKTPYIRGVIIEKPKPIIKEGVDVKFMQPADIKKTPYQVEVTEQVFKPLPKPPLPKIKTPKPTIEVLDITPPKEVPRMVGGAGLKTLPEPSYAPYEMEFTPMMKPSITEPVLVPGVVPKIDVGIKPEVTTMERVGLVSIPKVGEKLRFETKLKIEPVEMLKVEQIPRQEFISKQIPREAVIPREAIIPREALSYRQAQIQRQILEQRQVPRQVPVQVPRPRPPTVRLPKLIPPFLLLGKIPKVRLKKLRKPVPKRGFTFEIRRKGKWQRGKVPYAFATREGAEAFAQEKVLGEAAASYKIVRARPGKKVVRTRKKPSPYRKVLFRKAKKEPGVMIQKKKLRILTPGEKKEISYAGGIARMKGTKTPYFKQPKIKVKKKRVTKKTKGGKK